MVQKHFFLFFFHVASIAYLDSGLVMGLILTQIAIFVSKSNSNTSNALPLTSCILANCNLHSDSKPYFILGTPVYNSKLPLSY